MLAMRNLRQNRDRLVLGSFGMQQLQDELCAAARRRRHPDLGSMGLDNLVDNRQSQSGSPFKMRLEGLKNLLHKFGRHTWAGIPDSDTPEIAPATEGNGHRPFLIHGTNGVL